MKRMKNLHRMIIGIEGILTIRFVVSFFVVIVVFASSF